jgi:hypothetical protein
MEMKFRTLSGAIISHDPMAQAEAPLGLANPAAVDHVQPANLLRKQIERVIREYSADPTKAAMAVCVMLDEHLDLAEKGWFDNDEAVQEAIIAADMQDH